jgi:hypothetical protein
LQAYDKLNVQHIEQQEEKRTPTVRRKSTGAASIVSCKILSQGKTAKAFKPHEEITISVTTRFEEDIEKPVYGIVINRVGENPIFSTNTNLQGIKTDDVKAGEEITLTYTITNLLGNGNYRVAPAVASQDTRTIYDWQDEMAAFTILGWEDNYQPVYLDHTISTEKQST